VGSRTGLVRPTAEPIVRGPAAGANEIPPTYEPVDLPPIGRMDKAAMTRARMRHPPPAPRDRRLSYRRRLVQPEGHRLRAAAQVAYGSPLCGISVWLAPDP